MKRKSKCLISIVVILMLLIPSVSYGQKKSLIEPSNKTEISLKKEHSKKFENLQKNRLYKNVQLIKLGNVAKLSKENNGALPIKIPGTNKTYVARPVNIEYDSDLNFIWKGEFKKEEGYIKLICRDGEMFGNIQIDDRFFEIQAFEPGKNVMVEYDENELANMTCGNIHDDENCPVENTPLKSASAITTRSTVRVLVLYTDAADEAVTNIHNTANLAISQMNDAISNSDVNSALYMSLAGVEHLDFTETQTDVHGDVEGLSSNNIANNLRNENEADLVVLLTDGDYEIDYNGNLYNVYGIVDEIGPNNASAYAIVEADCATSSKYTFAHEVGHLFGGRHDNDTNGSYEHGYKFKTGWWPFRKTRTTIMYVNPGDYILNYSNPDVEYKNKATGTTSDNDVARKLETEASTVEAFRAYNPPMDVYITGPTYGDYQGTYTWYANVINGVAPYSYLWQFSLDGFEYLGTMGTSSSLTSPLPPCDYLYIKLTVTSSDGRTDVAYHTVINTYPGFEAPLEASIEQDGTETTVQPAKTEKSIDVFEPSISFRLFPNPVHDKATISYFLNEQKDVSLIIYDIRGNKMETIVKGTQSKGKYLSYFDVSKYTSGIYFCKLTMDDQSFTRGLSSNNYKY